MSKLVPLILELDDEIDNSEEMVGIHSISVDDDGKNNIGYIAIIREKSDHLNIRYGNLRARKPINININDKVF